MSYPLRQARPLSIVAIQSDGETDVTLVAPRPEFHDEPLQRVRVFSGRYLWPRGACHCCSNREILITPDNVALVSDLVSPGNFVLVNQGIRMKIVPTERIEWPPPYKVATEKYSGQVVLNDKGEVEHYVAGPAVSFY